MQVNNQILSDFQFYGKKNSEVSGTKGFLELFEQVLAGAVETSDSVQSFALIEVAIPKIEENPDEDEEDSTTELAENQVEVQTTSFSFEVDLIKNLHSGLSVPNLEEMTKSISSKENITNDLESTHVLHEGMANVDKGIVSVGRQLAKTVDIGSFILPKEIDVNQTLSQSTSGKENKNVLQNANLETEDIVQNTISSEIKTVVQGTISAEIKTVVQENEKAAEKSTMGMGDSEVGILKQQSVLETKKSNANQNFSHETIISKANNSINNLTGYAADLGQQPENSLRELTWNSLANGITVNELQKKEKKIVKDTEGKIDSKILPPKEELVMVKPNILPGGYQNLSSELDKTKVLSPNFNVTSMDAEVSEKRDLLSTGTLSEAEEAPQSATFKSYDQNLFQKNLTNVLFNVKEAPTPNIYQNQVHSQLIKSFSLMQQNNVNEVLINLKPEFLGNVSINLTIQNGEVIGRIAVAKKEVKDLIEGQLSSLKSSLAQVNIKVDQITVVQDASLKDSGQQNQAQTFSGGNSNGSKGNSDPLKYQTSPGARESEDTVQTPTGSYISQGVNYLV